MSAAQKHEEKLPTKLGHNIRGFSLRTFESQKREVMRLLYRIISR